jgi:hypothetical protein
MRPWMVEFDLPEITMEFAALIPEQRAAVGLLMSAGTITSYTLSADRSKLWVTLVAPSQEQATTILRKFPILPYTRWRITEAMFSEVTQVSIPRMSLN